MLSVTRKMPNNKTYRDTKSWNPFVGCNYQCLYCKPSYQKIVAWNGRMRKCLPCQSYTPHEHPERLGRMPKDKSIFVCSNGDISFSNAVFMKRVFQVMRNDTKKGRRFFVQSKNPSCLKQYLKLLPNNTFLITTLETNRDHGYSNFSNAPPPFQRYKDFLSLNWKKKIVTIEPIMAFDLDLFSKMIIAINPVAVYIGYNSHPKSYPIPEPEWDETLALWRVLRRKEIRVLPKETRKPCIPKKAYRDL
jgi:hypothetical protein